MSALAALFTLSACDQSREPSAEIETVQFEAAAYPYFHKFWDPIRERATAQQFEILITDGDKRHKFICHSANEPLKPVILHVSKGSVHIGHDLGKDLEDVSLEQLEASMTELISMDDDASVRLHARNNVSGERVNEVLWVLAQAGIQHLVAPTMDPEP